MNDPNRTLKWVLVVGLVGLGLVILYPPERKLKGGLDLVGGTSLLYEIDTSGIDPSQQRDLAERVLRILRERVDPNGQLNLEWRPVGGNRLEIRMPRPPKVALERREKYNTAIDRLHALNLTRFDVETAMQKPEAERSVALAALQRGVPERAVLLEQAAAAHEARLTAEAGGDSGQGSAAVKAYEDALRAVLDTNLPINRLTDLLAVKDAKKRREGLDRLRTEFPAFDAGTANEVNGKLLTKAIHAHEEWSSGKGSLEDPSDLKRLLRGAGVLEFRILAERDPSSPSNLDDPDSAQSQPVSQYVEQLARLGPRPRAGDRFRWFPIDNVLEFSHVEDEAQLEALKLRPDQPIIEEYAGRHYVLIHNEATYSMLKAAGKKPWSLKGAWPDRNPLTGKNTVSFQLDPRGGQLFRALTGRHVGRQLCIMLDDIAMSHATINEEIGERGQITGDFTTEKVQDLVRILDAGSLPARLKETPLAEKTIGPSLGETNRARGVRAALIGSLLVVLFMLFYYGLAGGGMASIALAMNLLFVLAAMALLQATFTLPGIAGLALSIGMAIDANVLIFERIREERAKGVIFRKALNAGYEKAFSAIFDGNLTTLITCVILGYLGSEEVKGFAVSLGIGIATSMFTALTVTRLVYNTLAAKGWLTDFRMRRLIGIPNINWVELRRVFWPISLAVVSVGMALFLWMSIRRTDILYDIEFLGGTSVQIDLKPGVNWTDDDARRAVTSLGAPGGDTSGLSAARWMETAGDRLTAAVVAEGESAGQYTMTSTTLTGEQLAALMRSALEGQMERDGLQVKENGIVIVGKVGVLTLQELKSAVARASTNAREVSNRLRNARVQSVSREDAEQGQSYEIVTTETNRELVQTAVLAAMSDRLRIQRAMVYTATRDEAVTKEPYFVIEASDRYLSDVLEGDATYDVRKYRGGAAIEVVLDAREAPLPPEELTRRLREVGLQREFEQYRTRETTVIPLGAAETGADGQRGYRRFAVCSIDESVLHHEDEVQWAEVLAKPLLAQVDAALAREKSLSQVVQFAPQVAGQTKDRAVFAAILAMLAIGAYVWFRFGTKDFGLAVLICLVHDVSVVLGCVALSHFLHSLFLGKMLLIDDFKVDLTMVAAVLTIIGYSLNDTIVVFDRIRENRGKAGTLSANLINTSINQTMSRTILTSFTVFLTVVVMYILGGPGIHGFAFAMLAGTISGTYSTVGIAIPLVHRPRALRTVTVVLAGLLLLGLIFVVVEQAAIRWILIGLTLIACAFAWTKVARPGAYPIGSRPARA